MCRLCVCLLGLTGLLFAQGLWETRAPYPLSLTEISGAEIDGRLYLLCGITPRGSTDAMHVYDPEIDSWSAAAPLPIPEGADHCNVAAAGGKLYLLGAIRIGSSFVEGRTHVYDPRTNRWEALATMPTPRGASGVAVIGTRIYVAGGLADGGRVVSTFEAFDTATGQWSRLPEMPTARDHLTAQAAGGRFYALAGRNGGINIARGSTEEFDPATNSWRARAPIPVQRGGIGSGVINGRIFVFGGEGDSGTPAQTFVDNHEYDPSGDTWRRMASMPTPRHGIYGVSSEGRIFVPGGGPRAGADFSNVHEVFYLPPADPPAISNVQHAASFTTTVTPGTLASVFGARLSLGRQRITQLPPPARLNAVSVRVNGNPAPLLFVSPGQINFLVPADTAPGTARVTVANAGSESAAFNLDVVTEPAPGIFSLDGSGRGQGAILIAGTGLIARATRDAFSRAPQRGEVVEIYGSGFRGSSEVTIGGVAAQVLFSGETRGFVGLDQINARIADNTPGGIAVPVIVRAGNRSSNPVTMAVVE